jgi:hypothetical protein
MSPASGPTHTIALLALLAAGPAQAAGEGSSAQDSEIADAPELDEASFPDLVADAQRLLTLRGFDPGPVDGLLGMRTRRAIRAYQATARDHGVLEALKGPPDQVDPDLVRIAPAAGAAD